MNVFPPVSKSYYTINKNPAANLSECLASMTREQLNALVENYSYDYEVFETKEQLVEFLSNRILNLCNYYFKLKDENVGLTYLEYIPENPEDILKDQLFSETEDEYTKRLQDIVSELIQYGLMFHFIDDDSYDHLIIPMEVCMEFVTGNMGGEGRDTFGIYSRFSQVAEILVSVYGIVPVKIMQTVWNQQFPEHQVNEQLCSELMEVSTAIEVPADFYNNELVNSSIFDDLYEYIKNERENNPRYIPSEELINSMLVAMDKDKTLCSNYYNEFEFEYYNSDYVNIKAFLKEKYEGKIPVEEVLFHLCFYIKSGYPLTQVVKILNEKDELLAGWNDLETERFGDLFKLFNDTCHHWTNWGWSPRDYSKYNR